MKLAVALAPLALAPLSLLAACAPHGLGGSGHADSQLIPPGYHPGTYFVVPTTATPERVPASLAMPYQTADTAQLLQYAPHTAMQASVAADGFRGRFRERAPYAAPYAYGELGGTAFDGEDTTFGVQARAGLRLTRYLGMEVESALGLTDVKTTVIDPGLGDVAIESRIERQFAGFAVGRIPISNITDLVARGGYHDTRIRGRGRASGPTGDLVAEAREDFDGFAYGAGVEVTLSPRNALRVDATRYEVDGDREIDAVSLTLQRRF